MRLTISRAELDSGASVQVGPKDRMLDLDMMANRHEPVAIRPVTNHDRKVISAVLLTEGLRHGKEVEIKFRPIWCKVFTLCSSTKDKLLALIIETADGQYWINKEKISPCTMTLAGNGIDPSIVSESQYVLGELLLQERRTDVILNLIQFLKQHC